MSRNSAVVPSSAQRLMTQPSMAASSLRSPSALMSSNLVPDLVPCWKLPKSLSSS